MSANPSSQMQRLLASNRNGKLNGDQWRELVLEPLAPLLFLLLPAILFLGPRLALLSWKVVLAGLVFFAVWMIYRARRYARLPIHSAVLYLSEQKLSSWKVWKPPVMQLESGDQVYFGQRLAPHVPLKKGEAYRVYYLQDRGKKILLSLAPVAHPQAQLWEPSAQFEQRFRQRRGV